MTLVSDLIAELEDMRRAHGNVPVRIGVQRLAVIASDETGQMLMADGAEFVTRGIIHVRKVVLADGSLEAKLCGQFLDG